MNVTAAKQALDTVSLAINFGIVLQETILAFFAEAKRFEEDADADMDDTGHMIDHTVYHITVDHEALRELVEALEIKKAYDESPFNALRRVLML